MYRHETLQRRPRGYVAVLCRTLFERARARLDETLCFRDSTPSTIGRSAPPAIGIRNRSVVKLRTRSTLYSSCDEGHNSPVQFLDDKADQMSSHTNMGSGDTATVIKKLPSENNEAVEEYGPNLKSLPTNDQVKELQTILRDKNTTRSDFKFYADRLIRLVIEESLNQLPFSKCVVTTPTGAKYKGLKYQKGNCGVSIVRSGEAMEQGLRDCCRSIRIGKILVESDVDTHEAKVVYAKFPDDISERKVLLMYPIMSTGNTVIKAIAVLKEHNVLEDNIILSNLFCTPFAAKTLVTAFPKMKILTSEIHHVAPNHFGQKYFGTD